MGGKVISIHIGSFLKQKHVKCAIELLSLQLNSTSRTHRTLDLEILRKEDALSKISLDQFYDCYIANDLCFNYPKLFSSTSYCVPKGDGGVRQFHFLEAHLWILYYALGFYLLDLTQAARSELHNIQERASMHTYYGANINLDNPQKSNIHYYDDYQDFTKKIRIAVSEKVENSKVAVLHLDIQEFFRSIDHSRMMQVLSEQALPASRLRLSYNEDTQLTIREILFLIMGCSEGLPISQQNIVSNLLSHLFLYPLDCCIREIQMNVVPSDLTFHRYVDDMFIIIEFPCEETNENIGVKMLDISTRIGEHLSNNLSLSLNPLKTRLDIIQSKKEAEDLIERSRLVSFYHPLPQQGGEKPQETLDRATKVLNELKRTFKERGYPERITANDDLALKQCFQNSVVHYVRTPEARQQLEDVFQDFHPCLIPKSIKVLIFLISCVPGAIDTLLTSVRENLGALQHSLTNLYLAEHLMLTDDYNGDLNEVITALAQRYNNPYMCLLNRLTNPLPPLKNRYIDIEDDFLGKHKSVMQQVRRTFIADRRGIHNLAYNHLLNTLQEWCFCYHQPGKDRKAYDRNHVVEWLEPIANHSEIIFIITMFDRRNRNAISHPGEECVEVLPVNQIEYNEHLGKLNDNLFNFAARIKYTEMTFYCLIISFIHVGLRPLVLESGEAVRSHRWRILLVQAILSRQSN